MLMGLENTILSADRLFMFLGFHSFSTSVLIILILIFGIVFINFYKKNRRRKQHEIALKKTKEEEKKNREKEFLKQAYFNSYYIIWPGFRKKYSQLTDSEFQEEYIRCSNLIVEHMVLEFKVSRMEAERIVKERFDVCKFDLVEATNPINNN
jgi:hypothetical protein